MSVETVTQARRALAQEGFVADLVADGPRLRIVSSGQTYAPADLVVARVIRLRGTTPEEEAVLFGLATAEASSSALCAALPASDARRGRRHRHTAAPEGQSRRRGPVPRQARSRCRRLRDPRGRAGDGGRAASPGAGTDRMGMALREGAPRIFERDAEAEVLHDAGMGVAA